MNSQPARLPKFDYAVFIGRFEPFHNAHRSVIDKALTLADKVIVLIGSANKPRSTKDPFFHDERVVMIGSAFDALAASKHRACASRRCATSRTPTSAGCARCSSRWRR
jgi:cytidyltransferase-like protein